MKVEKTKLIDVEKMTGVKDDRNVIKESELCENCRGNFYNYDYKYTGCCGFEKICKYLTACRSFIKMNNHLPSYYRNIKDKYNGDYKDRVWNNIEENNTKNVEEVKEETKSSIEITEKELCEYCGTKEKCVSCRYSKNCDVFYETTEKRPYYLLSPEKKYNGTTPNRLWGEKVWEEGNKESGKEENKGMGKIGVGIGVKEKDLCKACYGNVYFL